MLAPRLWSIAPTPESPVTALTCAEAQQRARLIDVSEYHVTLDLAGHDERFGSATVVRFGCRAPGASTFAEIRPAQLRRVVLNGQDLDPRTLAGNRLPLPGLQAVNELRVEADMSYSRTGAGLHRFTDDADGETYVAVHGGLADAQRVFAAFDQPDLKASITTTIRAPAHWTVLGNSVAQPTRPGWWELAATAPMSTYLFTAAAGPWHSIRADHGGIPFGLHARQSQAGSLHRDAAEIFAVTWACFDRYAEIFAEPYPYDSYDQAFVPELEAGAMENPGCVTFRDEFLLPAAATRAERQLRGVVIAHEMAHMWFGDLVTMRWWNDVWLSESFAEYMGFRVLSEATEFTGTWADFAVTRKPGAYDADQRPSTHPVAPEPWEVVDTEAARSAYDGISYAKGACALRQLVAWLGWPAFLAGINDYIARYRFGCADLADLLDCLSRTSGTDVRGWAGDWLGTAGVDTLTVSRPAGPARGWSVAHRGRRPHRIWLGVYDAGEAGQLTLRGRVPVLVPADGVDVTLPPAAFEPEPALVLPNDGDAGYCKIRLDPGSLATLTASLGRIPDPLNRAVAWNGVRDLVRDTELPPQDYIALVVTHLPAETDPAILGHVLSYARGTVADRYLPAGQRLPALAELTGLGQDLLGRPACDDSGGLRLIAARTLIDSAARGTDIAALRAWLDAGQLPGGPDLDSRLRWQILLRLAVLGAIGTGRLERETQADTTAAGRLSAARCRAARPDEAAKQGAWTAMFGDRAGTGSGYRLAAIAQGFWQADQADLLAGYVPGYFPALAEVAGRGDEDLARVLCQHGFPLHAVDTATLSAGEECLAGGGVTGALARLLGDQLADLRRALQVRSVHAGRVPGQAGNVGGSL